MVASKKYPPQKMKKGGMVDKLKNHAKEHELMKAKGMAKGGLNVKDEMPPMRKNKPASPAIKGSSKLEIKPQRL